MPAPLPPPVLALALTSGDLALVAIAVVAIVLVVLLFRRRAARPPAAPGAKLPPRPVRLGQPSEVDRVAAELERARQDRAVAEAKAKEEQAERAVREEAARRKAEEEAQRLVELDARAAAARAAAETARSEEERRLARAAAVEAEAEAARRRKEQDEAARRAAYEAKKSDDAEAKARRRADDEAKKLAELEEAQQRAEAAALEEAARARKVEAESGRTLADGLAKTRGGFMARLARLVGGAQALDDRFLGELEEILFSADIGVKTANRLLELVREKLARKELANPEKVKAALREEIEKILTIDGTFARGGMPAATESPQVVMIVGVNGSGKTTTIGKLAFKEKAAGRHVLLGAGDTFRAAAAEQLDVWAARAQVDVVRGPADSDPAAVCYEAVKKAVDERRDLCLLDTAGRLHTKTPLMDELKKVKRVVAKAMPTAPHETWLVVDGTTGQNALMQARQFHESLGLTGLVLTKLDGTAKGGVVIGICDELKLPVRYVGVGEKIGDLRAFDPHEFVAALFAET